MDSWYLMTGLFCCIPLMTAKYSALPPRIPCLVAVTRARDTASVPWPYPVLAILIAGIRSFQLLLRGIEHCCLSRRMWKWFRQDLKHSVPKGLLVKLGGTDKTFLSLSGARGHILPERLLASTTTYHDSAYLCVHWGGTEWSGRNQSEPWNTMITYFIPS